ncbi:MAG: ribulose-phosphate 3-epimerase [Trueperaceae bacterium]
MARLAASVLGADPGRLADATIAANDFGVPDLHLDAMDGHFAPNIAFGPDTVKALRPLFSGFFDVHLMLMQPERLLERYAESGADGMTIHLETTLHHHRHLAHIRKLGCQAGLAINPGTPIDAARELFELEAVDRLLIMSVNPGFAGASFIENLLRKISCARQLREENGWSYEISVDGGMKADNVLSVAQAGADIIVSGSGLYGGSSFAESADAIKMALGDLFDDGPRVGRSVRTS